MRPRLWRATLAGTVTAVAAAGLVPGVATAASPDLFISEYIEGSSNNKAIEIYNGTGAAVDLSAYALRLYFNGSTSFSSVPLSGTVANDDVFVLAHASANATILAAADQTSSASFYNGDDALVLVNGSTVVDSIGQVGVDPGTEWGTGLTSTADNTLRRLPSVTAGDTVIDDAFDPAAQWTGFDTDTVDGLGFHAADGGGPVDVPPVFSCPAISTVVGTAGSGAVTATDADDVITDLTVASPVAGITRTAFTPATAAGGTATATVGVAADVPAGTYPVTVTSTDAGGGTATCTVTVTVAEVLTVGQVQGATPDTGNARAHRSPLAPASGNGGSAGYHFVRGVVTQLAQARTSAGATTYGFFLQSRLGATDGDPRSADGIFVFMSTFTSLIGGYVPVVGDEVVLRARVSEYYDYTQLSSASLVSTVASGLDVNTAVAVTDARPPADLAAADRFWERHEGERMRVRSGAQTVSGRNVYPSTADAEVWLLDRDDPILKRTDQYARRVFRDAHPLDDVPGELFDNGNGSRIMIASMGVKAAANDSAALIPGAKTFDKLTGDAVGGLYYTFEKYAVQAEAVSFANGADPSKNNPPKPADRSSELAISSYNVENLYDFRDDPFDGCDFLGNTGCPGVSPPFDYVPANQAEYDAQLANLADQIITDLHSPDLILIEEAEDQDICTVTGGQLICGTTNNADGAPDTLQELALTVTRAGGPAYAAAYDRNGADARGITTAFLYRTDRLSLAPAAASDPVLGSAPAVQYRGAGLAGNADVQNPKALNAVLPADVDTSTGVDGSNVFTRAPQVGKFIVRAAPGSSDTYPLWAVANHYSSGPDSRVGQRREQAAYGAAIVDAIEAANAGAKVVYGGDLNVFPRPDDPIATAANPATSDQLGPLYESGLHNLYDDLLADAPSAAYSYSYEGQTQTLDHLFVNDALYADLIEMRAAHINADWSAEDASNGSRGSSDHDPQVARFHTRPSLTVADGQVSEGAKGTTPLAFTVSLSRATNKPVVVCATTLGITASAGSDYAPLIRCTTIAAGQTSTTFTVSVNGDRRKEADEKLTLLVAGVPGLRLSDPVAVGTIRNDD
ncbi:lamin tail domain-containing protein [Catenuloplanes atrovinosus]|uniref:Extracellular nuclease n=1 Tax=Catenuloplanes atrovinosus TaxID=137266 RepID=A0AAE4CDL9_9ACTN|nr:lamin tail domain-containing protein [Catenuloplanes atrovinosus]MDR7280557.1 putative extracellular nuclease [Catenuloplanes atrovinosus]